MNTEGETVTDADVLTKPSLVYFGYTFCPDVCPLTMNNLAVAKKSLPKAEQDELRVLGGLTVESWRRRADGSLRWKGRPVA